MTTQAQIEANRLNAQKSTGPRTMDGKRVASGNSTTHGLFARRPVLPGENLDAFLELQDALLADLAPVGAKEALLAKDVVDFTWRLDRIARIEEGILSSGVAAQE